MGCGRRLSGVMRFISAHRTCGDIVGDAEPLTATGYRLWLRCASGAAFDVWVTEGDATTDLLYSQMLAVENLSFAKTSSHAVDVITLLLHQLRLLPFLCGGHRQLVLENLALHQQLAVYKRTVTRPKLRATDRLLWVGLPRVWAGWRHSLVIVTPDTVLRWRRRRFREHWTKLSRRPTMGRPRVNLEVRALVVRMAAANPLVSLVRGPALS